MMPANGKDRTNQLQQILPHNPVCNTQSQGHTCSLQKTHLLCLLPKKIVHKLLAKFGQEDLFMKRCRKSVFQKYPGN